MTLRYFLIPTTFALALAVSAAPAAAQRGADDAGRRVGRHESHSPSTPAGRAFHDHGGSDPSWSEHHDVARRGFEGRIPSTRIIRPFRGPFFVFRPRLEVGFGFFAGWPVPYPWDYVAVYPYLYPYPNVYVAPDGTDYSFVPSDQQRNYGGISFDVTPSDATVVVDGIAVGQAMNFSSSSAPLTLNPGAHRVAIEKEGYRTMTFDSDVVAGQVIPYRGALQRG